MTRRAFSLIEMLVATVLVAVLMGGAMMLLAGVNRDVRTMSGAGRDHVDRVLDLMTRDLENAAATLTSADGRSIVLLGNVGIDRGTLAHDGRLARVVWRIDEHGKLSREQSYRDDSLRPDPWTELAGTDVREVSVSSEQGHATLIIESPHGVATRVVRMR